MATEASKPASSADSYIGSLISLTSKSEIRYEGILYSIDTEESSIGLRNVRSFGSEGRKKDGPQIPPSDRVYEYILFRGTDIKDLQVKSSPPIQAASSIDNDPAIIQSHYPRPSVPPTSLPSSIGVSPTDVNTHPPQLGHSGSNFPGGMSLYQPGANLGSWGPSPSPNINGNPLPMPMYWPGMYGPPSGLPHMQQQTLLRPPSGLLVPPSLQQPMQYPGFNAPPQAAAPNVPSSDSDLLNTSRSSTVLGFTAPQSIGSLNVPSSSTPLLATSSSSSAFPTASLPFSLPAAPSVTTAPETPSSSVLNKASNSVLPSTALTVGLPKFASLAVSDSETSSTKPSVSSMMNTVPSSTLPYQNLSQATTSVVASSAPGQREVPTPALVTPNQLLQSGQLQVSSRSSDSEVAPKDVEVAKASSLPKQAASSGKEKEAQPPILPLPPASKTYHKPNGASQMHHNYRGSARGRGSGGSRPVARFTEDFDFTAMNEKFNKDEVWGHLGKSKNKEGNENDDAGYEYEDGVDLPKIEAKPVYNKDDFFDSLSSNALDNESQNRRPRFSEQMKLDSETFGEFSRHRGGRGGRWMGRGGRGGRGQNYGRGYGGHSGSGRGYGYGGRGQGRGRGFSNQAS